MATLKLVFGALVLAGSAAGAAHAAEVARVVSGSRAKGEFVDVNLSVGWTREQREALIGREKQDPSTGGRTGTTRDLVYRQTRNVLDLRLDLGVFHDISLFLGAPLVLSDDRSLEFDRRDSDCAQAGASSVRCIDESSSSLLRDGLLPGAGTARYGLDAGNDGQPFSRPSDRVFQGPTRQGFEWLGLGLAWAPMSQRRDPTKPTWIIQIESRFAVGESMAFDPAKPDDNHGAGIGYHQLVFASIFNHTFGRFDPYVGGWYVLPLAGGSAFDTEALGKKAFSEPQHRLGAQAGFELLAWEHAPSKQRITLELRGHAELRLYGLARSELWEPLSGASSCGAMGGSCRAGIDRDFNGDGTREAHPGLSRSPSYGVFGGLAGLNLYIGRYGRLRGLVGLERVQDHFLGDGRSGDERIDSPGRRFRVEEGQGFVLQVEGGLSF